VIEERLAVGHVIARIITRENADELIEFLKNEKCGVTVIDAKGKKGDVKILFTVIKRKKLESIYEAIEKFTPDSFVSVEDVKSVSDEAFRDIPIKKKKSLGTFRALRKSK